MSIVKVVHSQLVFHGRAFDLRQDEIQLPDGRQARMDIVDHRDAVTILPVDNEGQIHFIRQYRHAIGAELLELPAGVMEVGETPLESALREIREETGMAAGRMREFGSFFMAPGYSTENMHLFLATDLHPSPLPGDDTEWLRVEKIPVAQAIHLAQTGKLKDSKSIVAMFWALPLLEQLPS